MADNDILADIVAGFDEQAQSGAYDAELDAFMEGEVVPVWKANSPQDTGAYTDSVKVTKPARGGRGQVGATDAAAHIIEYGSIHSPEFAPRAKTEAHFTRAS